MSRVYINARFLTQRLTGVQRFAQEVVGASDDLAAAGEWPPTTVLAPAGSGAAKFANLAFEQCGRRSGHGWEQTVLPRRARDGIQLSLGNSAPLLCGARQAVVIHDAGVFDVPESYVWRYRLWSRALQHGLAKRRARIITVSGFSRDRLAARLGIAGGRIGIMREGADHMLRLPADASVLARHGLTAGKFALCVGSQVRHKNVATMATVATLLQRHGIRLALVGSVDRAVFGDAVAAGGPAVRLGRVSDAALRALYEAALCLVFPSTYEGFGLPPVEAMLCGCPVIAQAGGAVAEICGEAALYGRDGAHIAALVRQLHDTQALRDAQVASGRRRVGGLTWANAARDLRDILHLGLPAATGGQRQ